MGNLTKRRIDALRPGNADQFLWDDAIPGFGVRAKPSGVRSFVLQYRNEDGRSRRLTLGRYGILTVETARKAAIEKLASVNRGEDPVAERARTRALPTIDELCDRYLTEHADVRNKPSTAKEVRRLVERHIKPALGRERVDRVTRADVARMHHEMRETPRQANFVLAVASKMFSLAELWGYRAEGSNPCRLVPRFGETKRERFLSETELSEIGKALSTSVTRGDTSLAVAGALRLLSLTGCRLGEVLSLRWEQVDLEAGTLALPDAKAGPRVHVIGTPACALLQGLPRTYGSPWVFNGRVAGRPLSAAALEHAWARIRKAANLPDVRIHDLRHTVGTYAGQTGANAFLVRDKLGHKTLTMTGRYVNRDASPLRILSDQVEARIANAMAGNIDIGATQTGSKSAA